MSEQVKYVVPAAVVETLTRVHTNAQAEGGSPALAALSLMSAVGAMPYRMEPEGDSPLIKHDIGTAAQLITEIAAHYRVDAVGLLAQAEAGSFLRIQEALASIGTEKAQLSVCGSLFRYCTNVVGFVFDDNMDDIALFIQDVTQFIAGLKVIANYSGLTLTECINTIEI